MRPEEKQISFYNRYFIFRKNRNINAKHLKSSFLTYAGLQEEQDRGMAGTASSSSGRVLDESTEKIALDKIARASVPIDVASKPAIAAHIIQSRGEEVAAATAGTGTGTGAGVRRTIKAKPKPTAAAAKKAEAEAAEAADAAAVEGAAAPIEQIEKTIKKRTKKATIIEDTPVPPPPPAAAEAAVKKAPRKKTEKAAPAAAAATTATTATGAATAEKKKTKKKAASDE
jgi:colicin import membrane protein